MTQPSRLWEPSADRSGSSRMRAFLDRCGCTTYEQGWGWSVSPGTAGDFWSAIADEFGVQWRAQPKGALIRDSSSITGARWFTGGLLNYAEICLNAVTTRPYEVAVRARSQTVPDRDLTWADLASLVARVRAGLVAAGVEAGDRVAGYLPNTPEALAVMLASASLGAVWTCCPPETGVAGSLDRLAQVEPLVLVAVDGYRYGSKEVDRRAELDAIKAALPSLRRSVCLPYLGMGPPEGWMSWDEFTANGGPLEFKPVRFDHPLYILYSSGTTGIPKAIVHGHGGITLEHVKALGLHFDLGPADTFFWYSTTGWMMWNFLVSGIALGSTIVLYDGDASDLWELMGSTGVTCGGVGAGFLVNEMKNHREPALDHDLRALRTLGSTGSPLPAAAAKWVYEHVKEDLLLSSFSGGTDVCTGFVGGSPLHSVWAGEISCRCLGARVEVFDEAGRPVVGREGELVITAPLPSMPVGIVGDADGSHYRSTYFGRYPGVWAHGDRATLTERGTIVITGRSDGTLNRGGVRMGTAEFYAVVESLPGVSDSLVVHMEDDAGGPGELLLFVVAAPGADSAALVGEVSTALRRDLSPRHVPDKVDIVAAIPRTLSGKKLEVPVKRILSGADPASAVAIVSVADPLSLDHFIEMGRSRTTD